MWRGPRGHAFAHAAWSPVSPSIWPTPSVSSSLQPACPPRAGTLRAPALSLCPGQGSLLRLWQTTVSEKQLGRSQTAHSGSQPPAWASRTVGSGCYLHPSPTHLAARPQGQSGIPGVVPRRPEPAALLGPLGPGEVGGSVVLGDLLCKGRGRFTRGLTRGQPEPPTPQEPSTPVRSICSASARSDPWNSRKSVGATKEFSWLCLLQASIMTSSRNSGAKERAGEVRPRPLPGSPPRRPSPQLTNAGHGHCSLEDVNRGIHSSLDTGKCAGGGHRGLRGGVQAQGGSRDESQCPLRAHEEPCEVVAGCTLPGPRGHIRQVSARPGGGGFLATSLS